MAFYKDVPDRHPRKKNYANQGSWDDEGTHYRPANRRFGPNAEEGEGENRTMRSGSRRPDGDRRPYGDRRKDGERRPYGEHRREGDRKPYGDRRDNARPADRRPREDRRPVEAAPCREVSYRDFEHRAPAAPVVPVEEQIDRLENVLAGRNPIREALKSGRDLEKLLVQKGELSGSAREIVQMAKEARVPVQEVDKSRLDEIAPHHQGMLAFASAYQYSTVDAILETARERGEEPFLILLDGVTDPHNLGAIIRSAECTGAHGVIIPERRSVGLTPACVKAAAGATEYMPVAKVTNLNREIEALQKRGVWVMAAAMDGESIYGVDLTGPVALVIGSEGDGVSQLTLKKCDRVVSLPMRGHIDSLNASVAAGAMMYAVLQARS
ncbi:MAG: 23S rRNA (guanosine(2251)-2'-O)-methyltransferase RlmB [Aristaeellaceae bacterium]